MTVEVEGLTQPDGVVNASEIHLQTFGFVGYVEAIESQSWRIGGRTVQITAESRVSPGIRVGDWVVVSVRSDDFGNLTALIISGSTLPTPTSVPTATAVPTTEPQELPDGIERDGDEAQDEQESGDVGDGDESEEADPQEDPDEEGQDESSHEDDAKDEQDEDDEKDQDEDKEEDDKDDD
jgi:hypothetical protein